MNVSQAQRLFIRSTEESLGFVELAKIAEKNGKSSRTMRDRAIEALEKFSNNDEAIEIIQEEDRKK